MNKIFSMLVLALIVVACQPKKQEDQSSADTAKAEEPVVPSFAAQLTEQQKADGWKLLFDGQTTNGWRFYKNKPNDSWEVVDGTLHCKPFVDGKENQRADIMTTDQYGNFELAFDWKISQQGNSGVMYRVTEEYDQPYFSGPEYQALDNEGWPGDLKDDQRSGSVYALYAAANAKPNPVGEWNQGKIIVNGDHVEHWLNGTKVVEYELNSADWKKRKGAGKWKDEKGYGVEQTGYIDFQDHDHEVWFRNIMIKTL